MPRYIYNVQGILKEVEAEGIDAGRYQVWKELKDSGRKIPYGDVRIARRSGPVGLEMLSEEPDERFNQLLKRTYGHADPVKPKKQSRVAKKATEEFLALFGEKPKEAYKPKIKRERMAKVAKEPPPKPRELTRDEARKRVMEMVWNSPPRVYRSKK